MSTCSLSPSLSHLLCLKRNCCKSCHCSLPAPLSIYIYGHTVTRASSHHSWIYVYSQDYIYIVALSPFHCSFLASYVSLIHALLLFRLASQLQFCLWAKPAIPLPKEWTVSVFGMCVLQDATTNGTSELLPLWRKQSLMIWMSGHHDWRWASCHQQLNCLNFCLSETG